MSGFPKVTHRVIKAEVQEKNGAFLACLSVVTYVDNGDDFTEYAFGEKSYSNENEAWGAAKYMEYRWQVPELIKNA